MIKRNLSGKIFVLLNMEENKSKIQIFFYDVFQNFNDSLRLKNAFKQFGLTKQEDISKALAVKLFSSSIYIQKDKFQ